MLSTRTSAQLYQWALGQADSVSPALLAAMAGCELPAIPEGVGLSPIVSPMVATACRPCGLPKRSGSAEEMVVALVPSTVTRA